MSMLYQNNGSSIKGLQVDSRVSCTSNGTYITITKTVNGEQGVYLPLTLTNKWLFECEIAAAGSLQWLAISISNQSSSCFFHAGYDGSYETYNSYLTGSSVTINHNRTVGDKIKITYDNGVLNFYINDILYQTINRNLTIGTKIGFYTNKNRVQHIKNIKLYTYDINDTSTLTGSLLEYGETLATNLNTKEIDAHPSEGLETLVNKILDIDSVDHDSFSDTGKNNKIDRYTFSKSNSKVTFTYDSTNKRYILNNSGSIGEPGARLKLGKIPFYDNMEISLDIYITQRSSSYNLIWILFANTFESNNYYYIGTWSNNYVLRKITNGTSSENKISGTLSKNVWYTYKLIFQNGNVILSIINKDTGNVVHSSTYTQLSNVNFLWGRMELNYYSSTTYFKNFLITYNDGVL